MTATVPIQIAEIQRVVAEHFGTRLIDMASERRARCVARPRQVAMYLARCLTPQSLPQIGRSFGGRDHTTVMHAVEMIERIMRGDPELPRGQLEQTEITAAVNIITTQLTDDGFDPRQGVLKLVA